MHLIETKLLLEHQANYKVGYLFLLSQLNLVNSVPTVTVMFLVIVQVGKTWK